MTKTQIFKDIDEFYRREDKSINGVDEWFADQNPDYEMYNETNEGCWNCFECENCVRCYGCDGCIACYDCVFCVDCMDCIERNGVFDADKLISQQFETSTLVDHDYKPCGVQNNDHDDSKITGK